MNSEVEKQSKRLDEWIMQSLEINNTEICLDESESKEMKEIFVKEVEWATMTERNVAKLVNDYLILGRYTFLQVYGHRTCALDHPLCLRCPKMSSQPFVSGEMYPTIAMELIETHPAITEEIAMANDSERNRAEAWAACKTKSYGAHFILECFYKHAPFAFTSLEAFDAVWNDHKALCDTAFIERYKGITTPLNLRTLCSSESPVQRNGHPIYCHVCCDHRVFD